MVAQNSLAYTNKDRASALSRLQNVVTGIDPDWPLDPAHFGNILLDAFSHVGDILFFYQDAQAREAHLVTARRRKNILSHLKAYPYTPGRNVPATTDVTFALAAVPANNVIIPVGTIVTTEDVGGSVDFRLLSNLLILSGANPPSVIGTVENSAEAADLFEGTDLPNQSYTLTKGPFIDTLPFSENGVVDDNGTYTKVDSLIASTATDLHYTLFVDENDRATLTFGNGINGVKPDGPLTVKYKVGGGKIGNVPANSITSIAGAFTDVVSNPISVSVTNASNVDTGADRESNASLRVNGPASLRTIKGVVTKTDFEEAAVRIPGVIRALLLTANEDEAVAENSGNLHIIATGGAQPSETLKESVYNAFYGPTRLYDTLMGFRLNVQGVLFKTVDIGMTVYFKKVDIVDKLTTAQEIRDSLTEFLQIVDDQGVTNTNIGFGYDYAEENISGVPELPISDFFDKVVSVSGVRKIGTQNTDFTLNGSHSDLILNPREFPKLGAITIKDGDTGLEI